ncbi:MAG: hypothetical protein LBP59_06345 [Planctomycetaceae bacterium]|jgi:hypothetical protein|nr:hypothetical protein [Planctomycetaceae bacterium]
MKKISCLFFCGFLLILVISKNVFSQIDHNHTPFEEFKTSENAKSSSIKEYESIAKELLVLPQEKRNYDLILKRFESFCKKYPHSSGSRLVISLVQRWFEEGIITSKQNAKFIELANKKQADVEEAKKILLNFDKAIQNNNITKLNDIAKKLEDFVKNVGIGNEAKYISTAQLIAIYQRTGNFIRAKELADDYIKNFSPDNMDFSGAVGFLFIAQQAKINYTLLTSNINEAVKEWEQVAEKYSADYPSFSMDAYAEGIKIAIAHKQGETGNDLCKKFVAKFPDSKDGRIFDTRLTMIIHETFPKEKKLDATQDKETIAKQIADARKKTLILIDDFKDTPFQKGAIHFLASLKEIEDISEGRILPNRNTHSHKVSTVKKYKILIITIIGVVIISIFVYQIFYYRKNKNMKG